MAWSCSPPTAGAFPRMIRVLLVVATRRPCYVRLRPRCDAPNAAALWRLTTCRASVRPAGPAPGALTRSACTCSTWGTPSPTTPSTAAPSAARCPAATWRSSWGCIGLPLSMAMGPALAARQWHQTWLWTGRPAPSGCGWTPTAAPRLRRQQDRRGQQAAACLKRGLRKWQERRRQQSQGQQGLQPSSPSPAVSSRRPRGMLTNRTARSGAGRSSRWLPSFGTHCAYTAPTMRPGESSHGLGRLGGSR